MDNHHPEGSRTGRLSAWSFRAPLLLAAALICLINGLNVAKLLPTRAPRNPWEACEVIEAWRSLRGLPVYDPSPEGHATHDYGALVPWVQGQIFGWVGPNNVSGRVLTLVSALATITLIAACTRTRGSVLSMALIWVGLLGINHRTAQYYIENRPDMTSLFFTTAGVVLLGLGMEKRRNSLIVLGTAGLIIGFFFKQPALVFAAVPAVALVVRGRRPSRSEIAMAVVPLAAALAVIPALRAFWPAVYHYSIEVPGSFRIHWRQVPLRVSEILQQSPLFLILFGEWLVVTGGSAREDRRMPWTLAALAVGLPFSTVACAKQGGTTNSALPALMAMMAFCALRLPGVLARMQQGAASFRSSAAIGSFAALLLLLNAFPPSRLRIPPPPWAEQYDRVVETAARLPGTVVCPEDPTIPMYAKEYAGRGLYPELDSHLEAGRWLQAIPDGMDREIRAADFVLDVRPHGDYFDQWFLDHRLDEQALRERGFVPDDGLLSDAPNYRIWRRGAPGPGTSSAASRTAWNAADEPRR